MCGKQGMPPENFNCCSALQQTFCLLQSNNGPLLVFGKKGRKLDAERKRTEGKKKQVADGKKAGGTREMMKRLGRSGEAVKWQRGPLFFHYR